MKKVTIDSQKFSFSENTLSIPLSELTKDIKVVDANLKLKIIQNDSLPTRFDIDFKPNESDRWNVDSIEASNDVDILTLNLSDEVQHCLDNNYSHLKLHFKTLTGEHVQLEKSEFDIDYLSLSEYQANGSSHNIDLGKAGSASIDLATQQVSLAVPLVSSDNNVLPLSISAHYNSVKNELMPTNGLPENWGLNVQQFLIKDDSTDRLRFTYIDGNGKNQIIEEKYYYKDGNDKHFVDYQELRVDLDGNLIYEDKKIFTQLEAPSGLKLAASIEDIKDSHLVDYEPEEYKNLKTQIDQLDDTIEDIEKNQTINKKQFCIYALTKQTLIKQLKDQYRSVKDTEKQVELQKKIEFIKYETQKNNRYFKLNKETYNDYLSPAFLNENGENNQEFNSVIIDQLYNAFIAEGGFSGGGSDLGDGDYCGGVFIDGPTDEQYLTGSILSGESSMIYTLGLKDENSNQVVKGSLEQQEQSLQDNIKVYTQNFKIEDFKSCVKNQLKLFGEKEFDDIDNIYTSFNYDIISGLHFAISFKDIVSMDLQLESLINSMKSNLKTLNKYKEQRKKYQHQKDQYELQIPVQYLYTENNVVYGFGRTDDTDTFRLILLSDPYENTIFIKYKEFNSNQIESITDSAGKIITFNYNDNGTFLESIVDSKDRIVKFSTPNNKLFQITHTNDSKSNYYFTNKDKQLVVDQSGFGVNLNKSLIPGDSGNVVDLKIENFSIVSGIKNGEIQYNDSLSFDDFADENIVLEKKKILNKSTCIRKNNLKSTTITSNNKSITYLFDNYGKVRTMYENNFKPDSEDNCSRVTEFSHQSNKKSVKIKQLPYSENLLNDVCFKDSHTIKHALYLGSAYCGADAIPYSYKICEKFHTIDAISTDKLEKVYMSEKMKEKINLSYKDCNHKAYMLSGWAKANSAYIDEKENTEDKTPTTYLDKRKFELRIEVTYLNFDKPQIEKKSFDWHNTDWQFCSVPIYINSDRIVSEVKCIIDYTNNTGKIEFTDLEFKEADFEESVYDEQNRIIEKSNAHSQWVIRFEYDKESTRVTKELIYRKTDIENIDSTPLVNTYEYNKQGNLIRTINYDGIVKENVFNDRGMIVKSVTYHKDEPSSKFYQESHLDEKGKSTQEVNELGLDGAKLEYIEGTGIVSSKTYDDDTKVSYGYTPDGKLIEISTTINGIENTNTYGYCLDTLTSLKHNDFSVDYAYDSDGKISSISIGGKEYLSKTYSDDTDNSKDEGIKNGSIKTETTSLANGEKYRQTFNDDGNVVETYFTPRPTDEEPSPVEILISQNIYDTLGRLVFVKEFVYNKDGSVEENISKIFIDKFGNTYKEEAEQHTENVKIENSYNDEHSKIESCTINIKDEELFYQYYYSDELEQKLNGVLLPNDIEQTIKYDKLGRLSQIESANINKEYNYLKSGDHSSNLISNIKFSSKSEPNENVHYTYDNKGNIIEIRSNNELLARYQYDGLSRIIREDNKKMNKTSVFSYDAGGNITQRLEYPFTLISNLDTMECTPFIYSYPTSGWRDQLIMLNGKKFEYDPIGNPTKYKDLNVNWSHGRQLDAYDVLKNENNQTIGQLVDYKYNSNGIRTSKTIYTDHPRFNFNGTNCECKEDCLCEKSFTTQFFLNGDKIIKQHDCCNDLTFYYGADEITGFHLKNNIVDADYFYKKNLQDDIIGIYDIYGKQIVRYTYDAWGNTKTEYLSKIIGEDGKIVEKFVVFKNDFKYNDTSDINAFIAFKNPFRYHSYYYDFETNLYYLNSRYYDPELCRFINADATIYANKNTFNGLNLFAYCVNNPINLYDDKGTSWWSNLWKKVKNFFENTWDVIVGTIVSVALVAGGIALTIFTAGTLANIGSAMIGAGVGGFIGGLQSKLEGGSYWGGYLGGAITGGLTAGLGAFFGPIGAFIGGTLGNFAGTVVTDAINGVDMSGSDYWLNLTADSLLSGLVAIGGYQFGEASKVLNIPGYRDLFAAITIWAEFAFSYLFDASKQFFRDVADFIRERFSFSF